MHTATFNLENARAPKPPPPGSHLGSAQASELAAREKGLQRIEGMKIAQTAIQSIGLSTKNPYGPATRPVEYALAVSILFTKATTQTIILGTDPRHVLSTSILWNSLSHDSRFQEVSISQALPGDIIIQSGWHQATGFAGIVGDHGRTVSNSRQGVQNNSSLAEIQRSPAPMAVFRYIGIQKYPSPSLANAGFNPDETRIPAGQPGGGQWTSGGAQNRKSLRGVYDRRRKAGHCAGEQITPEGTETEPVLREEMELEERLENFRVLTPEEKEYEKNQAEAEDRAKKVEDDLKAEAKGKKQIQKPPSLLEAIRRLVGGEAEKQPKEDNDSTKVHGNSKGSTKAQHVYEIRDQNGNLVKVGISGQPLNPSGASPRANQQAAGTENTPKVVEQIPEGPGARQKALESEQQRVNKYAAQNRGQSPPQNIRPKPANENTDPTHH